MFDSIVNVNTFLSEHWLAEVFPARLRELSKQWRADAEHGKATPLAGLRSVATDYQAALSRLPEPGADGYRAAATALHQLVLAAAGFDCQPVILETEQAEAPVRAPLLGRFPGLGEQDCVHILQARPVTSIDELFGADALLLDPVEVQATGGKAEQLATVSQAMGQLFLTDAAPRYLLVIAGAVVVLTDRARQAEGRYLAFDVATALDRRDAKATGELAHHAGLWSADVLLPSDDGKTALDTFTEDSEKHAEGVSEDLREGLRFSIELIANEILDNRRAAGQVVEGDSDLPQQLTTQSLRFLYRILFLLYTEARPELKILPAGAPEYDAGYGLERLRELVQVPLTGRSAEGHHLHESLALLFRLVNNGFQDPTGEALTFEAMRADLFDLKQTPLIDGAKLSNEVLQQVLQLLLLSKPSKRKGSQRGFISYAQLGINQLGAVYEGLMSYSGVIAAEAMVEVAKDGNADKGSWLVPAVKSADYDEKDLVWREDRDTGQRHLVRHARGSFVFRLSGRDRQRSASFYTPEVLTKTVVTHSLAELVTAETTAGQILEYRVCEPALGSGAFLNEAINQLAAKYLELRQAELGERIDADDYIPELQKVKAYLALHRAYGVDLNATAVELAEVSLWLNVMHEGLQAPWFGLHLRRGNSLIGARRATYDFTALGRGKKSWLTTPPTDRPLSAGPIGDGEVHHFLLPSAGWGAVGKAKQAKELAPEAAKALRDWQAAIKKKPTEQQLKRLSALGRRVERLWGLSLRRLQISEREIAREIDVWGAELEPVTAAVSREQVESELLDPEGPYMRLRLAMDAWCALWFWPLGRADADGNTPPAPPSLEEWLATLEGLLGADGVKPGNAGQGMFHETVEDFTELSQMDDLERSFYGMKNLWQLVSEHEWLGTARAIAVDEGFFHWELDFAHVFERGGFDLQVGNPPWVRPDWLEATVLADQDPYFLLQDKIGKGVFNTRRAAVLSSKEGVGSYLDDLTSWAGTVEHLGSPVSHPVLAGIRTNLYQNFMEQSWRNSGLLGVIGLIHPEGHFTDPKAGSLRAIAYCRLRRHWQFINEAQLFDDVHHMTLYGLHVYGPGSEVDFIQAVGLLVPSTIDLSLVDDGSGEIPGIQYPWGGWDIRPHASRITWVDRAVLTEWVKLFDEPGTIPVNARLLRPLTQGHVEILSVFSGQDARLADVGYQWSSLWNEKNAKDDGYIYWLTGVSPSLGETIYQGPNFTVGNPFARQANENCKNSSDYTTWNLEELPSALVSRTNYQRACSREKFDAAIPQWDDRPATDYWRIAWRSMTQPGLERSLHAAIIPPGVTHVHTVHTCTVSTCVTHVHTGKTLSVRPEDNRNTVLVAGLWVSLPYDYLVKISGMSHVHADLVDRFPAPLDHSAWPYLLQRTLRLNCLTRDYAPLWEGLHQDSFAEDSWTPAFTDWPALGVVEMQWTMDTPLRTDYERRAALVEIDALAALMLGLSADHLCLMFRAQFPVLRKYEYQMYFDNQGRKITQAHQSAGVHQQKDDFKLLQAHLNGEDSGDLLDRYELVEGVPGGFIQPNREAEMRAAYHDFENRLTGRGATDGP